MEYSQENFVAKFEKPSKGNAKKKLSDLPTETRPPINEQIKLVGISKAMSDIRDTIACPHLSLGAKLNKIEGIANKF